MSDPADRRTGDRLGRAAVPSNEELRRLFHTDPHFRQPDELDAFADPACDQESTPLGRQRQILQARAMGMLDDELVEQDKPETFDRRDDRTLTDTPPHDEDADLRLQQDNAAGPAGADQGAGPGGKRER